MKNRRFAIASFVMLALTAAWGAQHAIAQTPTPPAGFKRTELQRHDLAVAGREVVVARGEFQPGAAIPKHTHPGDEISYVLEGELTVEVDGKPPQKLKAGDSFFIPAGSPHLAKQAGKTASVVLSTYVVEKGKPLVVPVAAK